MKTLLRTMIAVAALTGCSMAAAGGSASANYAIPVSVINSGVGDMASASFKLSSSLGDSVYTGAMTSPSFQLLPGFWNEVAALTSCLLDLDGNTLIDAKTDGLMLMRAMLGLTGDAVTSGATAIGAPRANWVQVQPWVHLGKLDLDGDGKVDALTDGLMLVRAMMGLTGTAVTQGAVAAGAPRATWPDIRTYLNAVCGTNFAP